MARWNHKRNRLARKLEELEIEIASVDRELRRARRRLRRFGKNYRSGSVWRPSAPSNDPERILEEPKAPFAGSRPAVSVREEPAGYGSGDALPTQRSRSADGRMADYLASSFRGARPLRHEQRVTRNRAILVLVLLALALFSLFSWIRSW